MQDLIGVLDCDSKYTNDLIKAMEKLEVKTLRLPVSTTAHELEIYKLFGMSGLVIPGSNRSVYALDGPDPKILDLGIPILGICYGNQYIAAAKGSKVIKGEKEYGPKRLMVENHGRLLDGIETGADVFMNHSDYVTELPDYFDVLASTGDCKVAAYEHDNLFGLQFHPENLETDMGFKILENFLEITRTNALVEYINRTLRKPAVVAKEYVS